MEKPLKFILKNFGENQHPQKTAFSPYASTDCRIYPHPPYRASSPPISGKLTAPIGQVDPPYWARKKMPSALMPQGFEAIFRDPPKYL